MIFFLWLAPVADFCVPRVSQQAKPFAFPWSTTAHSGCAASLRCGAAALCHCVRPAVGEYFLNVFFFKKKKGWEFDGCKKTKQIVNQ